MPELYATHSKSNWSRSSTIYPLMSIQDIVEAMHHLSLPSKIAIALLVIFLSLEAVSFIRAKTRPQVPRARTRLLPFDFHLD